MTTRLKRAAGAMLTAFGAVTVMTVYLLAPLAIAINRLVESRIEAVVVAAGLVAAVTAFMLFVLVKTTHKQMEPTGSRVNQRSSQRIPVDFEVQLGDNEYGRAINLSLGGLAVVVEEERWSDHDRAETLLVRGIGEEGESRARVMRSEPIFFNGRRRWLLGLQVLAPSVPVTAPDDYIGDATGSEARR